MAEGSQPARPVLPKEMEHSLSIREFEQRFESLQAQMNRRLESLDDQVNVRVNHLRELVDERNHALSEALRLQASEYSRRLEGLNHAHDQAKENWRESLPRELFEATTKEWGTWRDGINKTMIIAQERNAVLTALEGKVGAIESALDKAVGALGLVRIMGFAGVIALLVALMRLAGMFGSPVAP